MQLNLSSANETFGVYLTVRKWIKFTMQYSVSLLFILNIHQPIQWIFCRKLKGEAREQNAFQLEWDLILEKNEIKALSSTVHLDYCHPHILLVTDWYGLIFYFLGGKCFTSKSSWEYDCRVRDVVIEWPERFCAIAEREKRLSWGERGFMHGSGCEPKNTSSKTKLLMC